ncbi:MAG: ZIP family metal transporter [Firmicutes bacterium]|nr:ZIP family metal transporter [Bacillota bacterium]
MPSLITVILIAFVAGAIGSGIGGVLGVIIKKPKKFYIACIMALAAGAMIAISLFELLPEAYEDGGLWAALVGLVLGVGIVLLFDIITHYVKKRKQAATKNDVIPLLQDSSLLDEKKKEPNEKRKLFKIGIAIFVAMMLHSLPEGIAIGAGYHAELGILLGIIMLLHYIPEGLAIAVPLKASGMSNIKIILLTIASGLPALLGAILGYYLGMNETLVAYALSFAAGVMIFVAFSQMIPLAFKYGQEADEETARAIKKNHVLTLLIILGVVITIVFTSLLH